MHADMDETLHVRLDGDMSRLLIKVDPSKYAQYKRYEHGKPVVYVRLRKALYGTLQAALLFWQNLSSFLIDTLGFTLNKYDKCVANKVINGHQCTILWHVDDLKISHVDKAMVDGIVSKLDAKYGTADTPLSVTKGKIHEYLGMTIDYSIPGKVKFEMNDYVQNVLEEVPEDMNSKAVTPASSILFDVNSNAEKLDDEKAVTFHHLTAKLLYLSKRARPDIQTAVAFLCTRVMQSDIDNWKKLARCI